MKTTTTNQTNAGTELAIVRELEPQANQPSNQLREILRCVLENLNLNIQPPVPPVLELKRRQVVARKFDAMPEGNRRETLKRVVEYLLLHGKTDSVMLTRDTALGDEATILDAIDYGHKTGLLRWVFEIHRPPSIAVNTDLQDALTVYLWG